MKAAPGRRPGADKVTVEDHADEHPIALKVMRLSKPNLRPPRPSLGQDCVPSLLILPESGTEVHIGQVFSSYICVSNKSNGPVRNVALTAEIQVNSKRFILSDQRVQSGKVSEEDAGSLNQTDYLSNTNNQLLVMVVAYELAEAGSHLLRVCVEYDGWRAGERKFLRKFYRFEVTSPLSFEYKIEEINCGGDSPHTLLCQIQLQNLTQTDMLLSEVAFLPTELITATAVVENAQSGSPYSAVLNSLPPLLKPQAKYSSVYKVESKHPNAIIQPGVANFGRVLTKWKSYYGEPGRIISQPIVWKGVKDIQARGDIRVRLSAEESKVVIGQHYKITMEVHNQGNSAIPLMFNIRQGQDDNTSYLISGPTRANLGQLAPAATLKHSFDLLPVAEGVCEVDNVFVKVAGDSPQIIQGYSSFWTKQPLRLYIVNPA